MGCARETADCDKTGFLGLSLTQLLFSCLQPLSVASPFPRILKEHTSGEGVTMLIKKLKQTFLLESLFAFPTKSFQFMNSSG